MGLFTKEEMVNVLSALWDKIFNTPEIMQSLGKEKLIVKFRFNDLDMEFFIDNTGEHPRYFWNPEENSAFDVEMILSSESSHKFWLEDLNIPLAIASRKIVAKGSVPKALKLIPALKPAFALYPEVLKEFGRTDLLPTTKPSKKKRSFKLFKKRKGKAFQKDAVPSVDIVLLDKESESPIQKKETSPNDVSEMDLLKVMVTIRAFEERLSQEFMLGNLPTEAIHLSIGQEAVAAGVCLNLRETDYLNTTHRGHGHVLAKGADVKKMMAEIYGKADGLCKGKGGSMHVTDSSRGILGANGIVGAGYLLALGAGFSIKKFKKSDDISVVIAGDGSVNQGMFHEAMNMISLMELPVLVVIENNLYGEFTSIERHSAVTDITRRAQAYNLESHRIDGNDVRVVFSEAGRIIEKIRRDGKPRLLELMTCRWHGHMEGDADTYRSEEEKEGYKKKDPILKLKKEMIQENITTEERIEEMIKGVRESIDEAVSFSLKAKDPETSMLQTDIYCPEDASIYTGSFDKDPQVKEVSVSLAINQALEEEMARDERVFLWGEDVSLGGYFNVTEGLIEKFGEGRIIDTPISENGFTGGAVGAAMTGMRPVTEILFADFLTCCMDPILNQAAKLRYMTGGQVSVPLTIRTPLGSGIGMAAQHSQSMEKFFFGIPGLVVIAPSDAFTAKGLLKSAIRSNNPTLFFEHKLLYAEAGTVPLKEYTLPIGKARVIKEGTDATLVTYLLGINIAMSTARILEDSGIDVEVIDLVTLYPMDTETILHSVAKTGFLATLEEGTFSGSIGSEVISRVALAGFGMMKRAPLKIAAPECPVPYAKSLENAMIPTPEEVAEKVAAALG